MIGYQSVRTKPTAEANQNCRINRTHQAITALARQMDNAARSIEALKEQGTAIENVLKLISGIADQINQSIHAFVQKRARASLI